MPLAGGRTEKLSRRDAIPNVEVRSRLLEGSPRIFVLAPSSGASGWRKNESSVQSSDWDTGKQRCTGIKTSHWPKFAPSLATEALCRQPHDGASIP
jgi:hypothetical protein